jgi:two-component sensor histidine kinase
MNPLTAKNLKSKWMLILYAWTAYGLYMTFQAIVVRSQLGSPVSPIKALISELSYSTLWFTFTPVILWLARRFRFEKGHRMGSMSVHAIAGFAFAFLHKGIHGILTDLYAQASEGTAFSWESQYHVLLRYFDYGIHLYWLIIFLFYAFEYYGRFREKERNALQLQAQLTQAQLDILKMQLQPHFLFNTLNSISVLVQKNPDMARRMIIKLSELLRATLENGRSQEIPFRDELDFLNHYLEIEQIRFEDRLTIRQNIGSETLNALVPNMMLQPIVENALKHGLASRRGPALVEITSFRKDDTLNIQVVDNGNGFPKKDPGECKEGVGFANTRARLEQLYGKNQSFEYADRNGGGVTVTITVPYRVG